jgi:hypothetical protein
MGGIPDTRRRRGEPTPIADILARTMREFAASTSARSPDESRQRVRDLVARGEARLRELCDLPTHAAVDRLLADAGFCDKARNARLRWSRLLAQRLGVEAPALVLLILADVVADGSVVNVGGCLAWRLPRIMAGKAAAALSGHATPGLAAALDAITRRNRTV